MTTGLSSPPTRCGTGVASADAGTAYIEPGSSWQNPWVESYGSRMRDELSAIEQFDTLLEAQVLIGDWREEYNEYRPRPRDADTGRFRSAVADQPATAHTADRSSGSGHSR